MGDDVSTVTFLFTDLEGSTRLWEEHPEAMKAALARHDAILREAIERNRGRVFSTGGDGVAASFGSAIAALQAAIEAQRSLTNEQWEDTGALRARMAIHVGEAQERAGDYFGPTLNRTARLMSAAHGGQIVLTRAAEEVARDHLQSGVRLLDLGEHRLRDLVLAERVFQVVDAELPSEFAALRSLDSFPQNLPVQRTPLIGRERQLARIEEELGLHRLLTLTGVGGVGKTRLALQAAADMLDRFPDGAWFVGLAQLTDDSLVGSAVASALLIPERSGVDAQRAVVDALRMRTLLLVLDNCEHMLDAIGRLADALLGECPDVRIIATSREGLGVDGEQILPTPSLSLPAPDDALTLTTARAAAAVELFCVRASAVRPDFALNESNARVVSELCTRLDGIPLAIELAAARTNAVAPADILARLDRRFLLLTGGSRTKLERHHTLRAAVDWSHELLSQPERQLFARLSVFVGGFTLESAEAVASGDGVEAAEVLDLLAGLVSKSMVVADEAGDSVRYRMLETLRQYGHDRLLESGEAEAMRARHARYFLEVSAAVGAAFPSVLQREAGSRFDVEFENLGVALDWFLETGDAQGAAALLLDSPLFSFTTASQAGRWQDRLRRSDAVLELAPALDPQTRAELWASAAWSASQAGEHARAASLAEESIACAEAAGLPPPSLGPQTLGLLALWTNDPERALGCMQTAVELSRAKDDRALVAFQLSQVGFVLGQAGRVDEAIATGEQALALARSVGAPALVAGSAFQLGLSYRAVDPNRALEIVEESIAAIDIASTVNSEWNWLALAQVQIKLDRNAEALDSCRAGLVNVGRFGAHFSVPATLEAAARALLHLGRAEAAATMLGAAEWYRAELGTTGTSGDVVARERSVARLRDVLDESAFSEAWSAGQNRTIGDLVELLER